MTVPPEMLRVLRQWVEKAEHDLINAEHTLKLKKNCPFDTVCFHAQQCAEKYLKALLFFCSIEFPPKHNLRILMQLIPAEVALGLDSKAVIGLTRYAVDARVMPHQLSIQLLESGRYPNPPNVAFSFTFTATFTFTGLKTCSLTF